MFPLQVQGLLVECWAPAATARPSPREIELFLQRKVSPENYKQWKNMTNVEHNMITSDIFFFRILASDRPLPASALASLHIIFEIYTIQFILIELMSSCVSWVRISCSQHVPNHKSITKGTIDLMSISWYSNSWPNFSFKILTKSQPPNMNQKYNSKYWPNFSFIIVTKIQVLTSLPVRTLRKIWHLELFWWDLRCNLTLSHFFRAER